MHLPARVRSVLGGVADLASAGPMTARAAWTARRHQDRPRDPHEFRAHFLIEGDPVRGLSPAARYRAWQYVPLLEKLGIPCVVCPSRPGKYFAAAASYQRWHARLPRLAIAWALAQYRRQGWNRMRDFRNAAGNTVVFLQRDLVALSHSRIEQYLPLFQRRIVFDFDDAIFANPSWSQAPGQEQINRELRDKIARICQLSSAVIAANPYLADFAGRYNDDVHVLPTMLCTEEFHPPAIKQPHDRLVIGWVGTSGNLYYLRRIAPVLRELARTHSFVLRVVCNEVPRNDLPDLPAANIDFVKWSPTGEVERIQEFDIGIMPLDDDEWTKGKAGFKLIQYMACGIPIVWSPVGANPDVAGADGDCGFAASSPADWTRALTRLLDDDNLRTAMAARGRQRAMERFDRRANAGKLASILRRVARDG
jgi:glycosyltransferase involved in cell wall biosynthesis